MNGAAFLVPAIGLASGVVAVAVAIVADVAAVVGIDDNAPRAAVVDRKTIAQAGFSMLGPVAVLGQTRASCVVEGGLRPVVAVVGFAVGFRVFVVRPYGPTPSSLLHAHVPIQEKINIRISYELTGIEKCIQSILNGQSRCHLTFSRSSEA